MEETLKKILAKLEKIDARLDEQDEKLGAYLAAKALERMGEDDDPDRFTFDLQEYLRRPQHPVSQQVEQIPPCTITVSTSDTVDCGDQYYGNKKGTYAQESE